MKTIWQLYESTMRDCKVSLVNDRTKLDENKNHIIDKLDMADWQREAIRKFFNRHPNLENKLNWNQTNMSELWKEFERLEDAYPEPIDPDTVSELTDKRNEGNGIVSYEVQDDEKGMHAVRGIIDTHWGFDANPWCLASIEKNGSMKSAWNYWNQYNALPKRIAFKNGKLLAFMGVDPDEGKEQWIRHVMGDAYEEYVLDAEADGEEILEFDDWVDNNKEFYEDMFYEMKPKEIWWDRNNYRFSSLEDLNNAQKK